MTIEEIQQYVLEHCQGDDRYWERRMIEELIARVRELEYKRGMEKDFAAGEFNCY